MKNSSRLRVLFLLVCSSLIVCATSAQQHKSTSRKLAVMTNLDVIKMVKAGVPETIIVTTIQTRKSKFDVSPDGLIALEKAGVTQTEMDAIMAAASGTAPATATSPAAVGTPPAASPATAAASGGSPPPEPTSPLPPAQSNMPTVSVLLNGMPQEIPMEKTQLAETKTKPTSMTSLAGDSAVTQAMQAGIGTATMSATSHMTSMAGASTIQQAGSIFSGMMARRRPTVTYVWGVPSPASTNVLQTVSPAFTVNFSITPGVHPDDFAPAIVKLTPAQNSCRIVGATQGKEDMSSSAAADWQIYSKFLEERVRANVQKTGTGQYRISPSAALLPGEYAVVLRPISKSKEFSGGDVARAQGDGLMFDSVWSFEVSNDAH
ncbi:MAG: hypothetical protein ROO76_15635 [Terriglobia bacterium]|jgi:hypothetical protein|nr:hypothetical protein [Terriglobia bacterium]